MRFNLRNELLIIGFLTLLLILVISLFPIKALRIVLGLPFILFFPGYTLIAALFPRKTNLDRVERVALSFGLSIAIVPLIGLVLNYTPWGIRLYPILISVSGFIFLASGFAWWRRRSLPPDERFEPRLNISLGRFRGQSPLDRALSIALIVAILGAIGSLGYVIAKPKVGERFTEFYILGPGGKAEGYSQKLKLGEEGKVILGITNHEHEEMGYLVKVKMAGNELKEIGPIELAHGEKWERGISFVPQKAGKDEKVEFLLYKIRRLGERGNTLLRLRLNKESLAGGEGKRKSFDAVVRNLGDKNAKFEIRLAGKDRNLRLGPVKLGGGEKWNEEHFVKGDAKVDFQLLRDGKIIYQEKMKNYPSLHLWLDVEPSGKAAR